MCGPAFDAGAVLATSDSASCASADIAHVFSASYWSFLLAPLPAIVVARIYGKPVIINYRSGEAPGSPETIRHCTVPFCANADRNVVPSKFPPRRLFSGSVSRPRSFPTSSILIGLPFDAGNVSATAAVHAQLRAAYNIRVHAQGVRDRAGGVSRCLAYAGWLGIAARRPPAAGRLSEASQRRLCREPSLPTSLAVLRRRRYLSADPDIDNMPASVLEAFASGCVVVSTDAGGVPTILTDGVKATWCRAAIIAPPRRPRFASMEDP